MRRHPRRCAIPPHPQVALQEGFERPVQHPVHIANLHLCPVVFRDAVRLQHIRPDLRAELDVQLCVFPTCRLASFFFSSSYSYNRDRSIFIAFSRFLCCERSFWHCTTMLVGK